MKSRVIKLSVGLLTFALGVIVGLSRLSEQVPSASDVSGGQAAAMVSTHKSIAVEAKTVAPTGLPASLDPYSIKRYVDEHDAIHVLSLWQALGIGAEMQTVYSRIGVEPLNGEPVLFDSCENCAAEISQVELDSTPGKEVLLKVYQNWGLSRYLIFQ